MSRTDITIVVGNPKLQSRTREAAELLADAIGGTASRETIEIAPMGSELLGWGSDSVAQVKERIASSQLAIFASPTFKASFTGLLKLLLDQFAGETGLAGVVAVPLMLGSGDRHALAAEYTLRPVLSELGAMTLPGLYLSDQTFRDDGAIQAYASRWHEPVNRLLGKVPA